jgi:prepilin-type processing-associated H-X9-DG protein
MTRKKKTLLAAASLAALAMIAVAISLKLTSKSDPSDPDGSRTPLGGMFAKAMSVSRLKDQMGDLRDLHPAMMKYAEAHADELPRTLVELHPYLPKKLAALSDKDWELPSSGKMKPLMDGPDAPTAVLLQQKNIPPNKPRIICYADGHVEFKP